MLAVPRLPAHPTDFGVLNIQRLFEHRRAARPDSVRTESARSSPTSVPDSNSETTFPQVRPHFPSLTAGEHLCENRPRPTGQPVRTTVKPTDHAIKAARGRNRAIEGRDVRRPCQGTHNIRERHVSRARSGFPQWTNETSRGHGQVR